MLWVEISGQEVRTMGLCWICKQYLMGVIEPVSLGDLQIPIWSWKWTVRTVLRKASRKGYDVIHKTDREEVAWARREIGTNPRQEKRPHQWPDVEHFSLWSLHLANTAKGILFFNTCSSVTRDPVGFFFHYCMGTGSSHIWRTQNSTQDIFRTLLPCLLNPCATESPVRLDFLLLVVMWWWWLLCCVSYIQADHRNLMNNDF